MEINRAEMMLNYVESYYRESRLYTVQNNAKGQEFNIIHTILEDLPKQFHPQTATWGLRLWEELLDIKSSNSNSLEERRGEAILKIMSSQTMTPIRLERVLENVTKTEVKVINNIAPYTFAVEIAADENIIQTNFANIRKIIEDIRPAHLAFLTSVFFLIEVLCKMNYRSELILETEYAIFPKILKNYLDGIIKMDGSHRLNSYKEKRIFELYQSKLDLETTLQSIIWPESRCELGDNYQIKEIYNTAIDFATEIYSKIGYQYNLEQESEIDEKISLEQECEFEDNYQIKNTYTTKLDIEIENHSKINYITNMELESNVTEKIKLEPEVKLEDRNLIKSTYGSELEYNSQTKPKTEYKKRVEFTTNIKPNYYVTQEKEIITTYRSKETYLSSLNYKVNEIKNKTRYKEEIRIESKEKIKLEYSCGLIVEKQRIQMNGIRKMNGTRKMKSKVIYYDAI